MPMNSTHASDALANLPGNMLAELGLALARHGLILRGGFHPSHEDAGLEGAGTLLLVGNAGEAMWQHFAPHRDSGPNPMNRWTMRVIEPIAATFGAKTLYPFGKPHWPFQRWALRAET